MARRIVLFLILLASAYLCFDIYRLYTARHNLADVAEGYAFGPDKASLEVTEFLDYGCPFCRQVHPAIMEAVRQDGDVRYAPRPLASNGDALRAAYIAYAAGLQGKFREMHTALMGNYRVLNEDLLDELMEKTGIDKARIDKDIKGEKVKAMIDKNNRLFSKLHGRETPMFVIGKKMIYIPEGRLPETPDFLEMFKKARAENN